MEPARNTASFDCHVVAPGGIAPESREVIEERPLRIVIDGKPAATLMRTPGDEIELATGFLFTEGIVASPRQVGAVEFYRGQSSQESDEVSITLARSDPAGQTDSTDKLNRPFQQRPDRLSAEQVFLVRETMFAAQELFRRTGAAHAAAIAELPFGGAETAIVCEDLRRHNALDKAVGAALRRGLQLDRSLLFLSSRLSYDMVAKAARAGICAVAGVSAPSAAAVRLARRLNMFLTGFARQQSMTVYSGVEAVESTEGPAP